MSESSTDRIEKRIELKAPVSRVWKALTDHEEFGSWFQVNLESPFVVGQATKGNITYPGYEHMVMDVVVQKMESEKLFSYTWKPTAVDPEKDCSNDPWTLVEFKLEPTESGTLLVISESGFDQLPEDVREELFRGNEGGWSEQTKNIESYINENL